VTCRPPLPLPLPLPLHSSMLVPNCIFRSNGAAILLSNKRSDAWRAKYKLRHLVRTTVSSDEAFGCVYQMEDDNGIRGVRLGKELMAVAGASFLGLNQSACVICSGVGVFHMLSLTHALCVTVAGRAQLLLYSS
jgi:FAE1/Type III polyketide synthase-like protein